MESYSNFRTNRLSFLSPALVVLISVQIAIFISTETYAQEIAYVHKQTGQTYFVLQVSGEYSIGVTNEEITKKTEVISIRRTSLYINSIGYKQVIPVRIYPNRFYNKFRAIKKLTALAQRRW